MRVLVSMSLVLVVVALGAAAGCRSPNRNSDGSVDGRRLFRMTCSQCHGEGGRGDGPQGSVLGAKDLLREEARRMSDVEITHQIRAGRGRMPAFGMVFSDEEVAALVAEVRRMQGLAGAGTQTAVPKK